jgi:Zn-finger nucleic acid-binding protein
MLKCPNHCGPLTALFYEGIEIDICEACKGVWLDYGELTHILEKPRQWPEDTVRKVLGRLVRYNAPPFGDARELLCPKCSVALEEVNYQGTSNIILNPCLNLDGVWLDAGRLLDIRIFMGHWADWAQDHKEKIQETLCKVGSSFQAARRARHVDNGPSRSRIANELVYEALELLDQWRGVDGTA